MSSKNASRAAPSGDSKASGTAAPAGTIDVYTIANDGVKTYLGWVTDKAKLAFFSRAGDRLINPEKYSRRSKPGVRSDRLFPPKRTTKAYELHLGPNVDKVAAEIIIKWINDNSIASPKTFVLDVALFGPTRPSFEMALNVHHAMNAFDLNRDVTGKEFRNAIFDYINTRDNPAVPSAADFKNCMEKIDFDGGVASCMMNQIMWRSVNRNIDPAALDEIKLYCWETDRVEMMKAIGDQIVLKKLANRKRTSGRPIEHGW